MFRAGGEPPAVMPYIASGPRSMIGHATWEGRVIQNNDHVFLEVGGCYRRYHTAMMRTVVFGELTDSMYKAQETMKRAIDCMHEMIQPGMTVSDVDNLVRNIISENDIGARLITRSGYSIGIAFPPSWDEGYMLSLKQGSSEILRQGMTFHMIPWMWGVDGDKTVGISDTIYITEDGCASFFEHTDRDFVVKDSDTAQGNPVPLAAVPASANNPEAGKVEQEKTRKKKTDTGAEVNDAGSR
jgi:Xaa-Pro dipeptidase